MAVPNLLFYENRIKCGYTPNPLKQFMYSNSPFLFIDVPGGQESLKGTSFYNMDEVDVITQLKEYCLRIVGNSLEVASQHAELPIQKFTKNSIYVITPYNAQKNAIAECFADDGIED